MPDTAATNPFWGVKGRAVVALSGSKTIAVAKTYEDAVDIAAEHNATVLALNADVQPLVDMLKEGTVNASPT